MTTYRETSKTFKPTEIPAPTPVPKCTDIRKAVCKVYGMPNTALTVGKNTRTVAEARYVCIWFMRNTLKMSYPEIASELCRVPSGCIRAVNMVDTYRRERPLAAQRIQMIANELLKMAGAPC